MSEQKFYDAYITKSDEKDIYTFQASTDKVDSYGDIVVQEGINLSTYKKNPIILYQHNSNEPIGKAVDVRVARKGLIADIKLAPPGTSPVVDTVRKLIEAGILRAVSIGFSAIETETIKNKEGQWTGYKFLKSLLREISVVSIPANDEALAIARSFNLSRSHMQTLFTKNDKYTKQLQNRNRVRYLELN